MVLWKRLDWPTGAARCRGAWCKIARFIFGLLLGVIIGCSMSLTYSINLQQPVRAGYDCPRAEQTAPVQLKNSPIHLKVQHDSSENVPSISPSDVVQPVTDQDQFETDDSLNLLRFIDPPFSSNRKANVHGSESKMTIREPLLVAVITSNSRASQMDAIYDTWGRSVTQTIFFTASDEGSDNMVLDGLPIVKLSGIRDESPPLVKTLAVLSYLNKHYSHKYNWFFRVNDTAYLRGDRLLELVNQMDSAIPVYMGHPASHGSKEANDPSSDCYCRGGPGVLLSRAALQALSPHLDWCLENSRQQNREQQWYGEDEQLGLCLNRRLGIHCCMDSTKKLSRYFVEDTAGHSKTLSSISTQPVFTDLLTLSPVTSVEQMYSVHYYYTLLKHKEVSHQIQLLNETIQQLCQQLPKLLQLKFGDGMCVQESEKPPVKQSSKSMTASIPVSFRPQNRFEVMKWNYFDALALYEDDNLNPRKPLKAYKYNLLELQKALLEAVKIANRQHPVKIKFKQLINGYVRHNALVGNEYIIDAQFVEVRNPHKHINKRVSLVRPLANQYTIQFSKANGTEPVHIVVPLYKVNSRFSDFMQMYEQTCLSNEENTHLVLAVFGESDVSLVRSTVATYTDRYPNAHITVLLGQGEFSRAKALDLGLSSLEDNSLAFLCDVDIHIDTSFFARCRRNTIQGKRVYYPEVFKLYNMDYVYRNQAKPKHPSIVRENGHWGHYAFGMVCIYKSDYRLVGGFDVNKMGWGGEDVQLYENVIRARLEVFRTPDVGLIHQWHSKMCTGHISSKQYEQCMMSKAEVLADRRELAQYIYELEEQHQQKS